MKINQNITLHQPVAALSPQKIEWKQPVSVALIALLIVFARMPDRLIYGFLWGEDGVIFLQQAYGLGGHSIFTQYAGYLHVIPRLIALIFSKLVLMQYSPLPFAWISALILCATCAYLFTFARKILPLPAAWIFGLAPILVPNSGEVWLTITNLQWIIAPALLVLLWEEIYSPDVKVSRSISGIVRGIMIILMTLTGPFGLLFSPAVAIGLFITKRTQQSGRMWVVIAAYFVAAAIQLMTIMMQPEISKGVGALTYLNFPWSGNFLRFLVLDFAMPATWIDLLGSMRPYTALLVAAAIIACLLMTGKAVRVACIALAFFAAGLWVLGVVRSGTPQINLMWSGYGGRFFYMPFIFIVWTLLLSIANTQYSAIKFVAGFLLAMVAINSISLFKPPVWPRPYIIYESGIPAALSVLPSAEWNVKLPTALGVREYTH